MITCCISSCSNLLSMIIFLHCTRLSTKQAIKYDHINLYRIVRSGLRSHRRSADGRSNERTNLSLEVAERPGIYTEKCKIKIFELNIYCHQHPTFFHLELGVMGGARVGLLLKSCTYNALCRCKEYNIYIHTHLQSGLFTFYYLYMYIHKFGH